MLDPESASIVQELMKDWKELNLQITDESAGMRNKEPLETGKEMKKYCLKEIRQLFRSLLNY